MKTPTPAHRIPGLTLPRIAPPWTIGLVRPLNATAFVAALAVLGALTVPSHAIACTCPVRSDAACINTAQSGLGSPYAWGGARWSTYDRDWGGADCSGFVIKCWQVDRASSIYEQYHPYGTYHIFNTGEHWYSIPRSSVARADAVGYSDPDGSGPATGHVVLFDRGDPWGWALVYEAPGTGLRIRHAWRDISASKWRFRRRHNLVRTS